MKPEKPESEFAANFTFIRRLIWIWVIPIYLLTWMIHFAAMQNGIAGFLAFICYFMMVAGNWAMLRARLLYNQ
jgi:hypothetical protein